MPDIVAGGSPIGATVIEVAESDIGAQRASIGVVVERTRPSVSAQKAVSILKAPFDSRDAGVVTSIAKARILNVDVGKLRIGPVRLHRVAAKWNHLGQALRRDLVQRDVAAWQLVRKVAEERNLGQESGDLALIAEVEHVRIAGAARAFEERDRRRGLLAHPHRAEAVA